MRRRVTFIIINILILSACTPLSYPTFDSVQTASPSPISQEAQPNFIPTQGETTDMTPIPYTPSSPNLQNLIEQAKIDLAHRLSIPVDQITVVDAREVTWSNSSLGCPQPGMMYSQVLTPGYLILIHAKDQDYEYHAGKNSDAFYCENPSPPVPDMPSDT